MILAVIDTEGNLGTVPLERLVVGVLNGALYVSERGEQALSPVYRGAHAIELREILVEIVDDALDHGRSPRVVDLRGLVAGFAANHEPPPSDP